MKINMSKGIKKLFEEMSICGVRVDYKTEKSCGCQSITGLDIELLKEGIEEGKIYDVLEVEEYKLYINKKLSFGSAISIFLNEKGYGDPIIIEGLYIK